VLTARLKNRSTPEAPAFVGAPSAAAGSTIAGAAHENAGFDAPSSFVDVAAPPNLAWEQYAWEPLETLVDILVADQCCLSCWFDTMFARHSLEVVLGRSPWTVKSAHQLDFAAGYYRHHMVLPQLVVSEQKWRFGNTTLIQVGTIH
jgi:hypothetical protein